MMKSLALFSVLAACSVAGAQATNSMAVAGDSSQQAAPIVRQAPADHYRHRQDQIVDSQPISGVWLRSLSSSNLKTISATPQRAEVRLEHGKLNVDVNHPAQHAAILIDMPGGQTSLLKDGLYTFNADTNTVRVLRGEAAAYPGPISANADVKPIKVKEDHQLALMAATDGKPGEIKSVEAYPYELTADLLPQGGGGGGRGYADSFDGDYPAYGGYPYYAGGWGAPYGYGFYPGYYGYGYGYPVVGFGFGYGGGFRGGYGGFRGGFRR